MKSSFLLISLLFGLAFGCGKAPLYPTNLQAKLQPGDLVFQDLDCGPLCSAIEEVTAKRGFPRVSHVAMVLTVSPKQVLLMEALGSVRKIPLKDFSKRSRARSGRAKIVVARLKPHLRHHIPFVLMELKKRLGSPYDEAFLPDNGAYYCSELIADAFASIGVDLFPRHPMEFGSPGSRSRQVWEQHFAKTGRLLPQGKPGTNPVDLLSSPYVERLYTY